VSGPAAAIASAVVERSDGTHRLLLGPRLAVLRIPRDLPRSALADAGYGAFLDTAPPPVPADADLPGPVRNDLLVLDQTRRRWADGLEPLLGTRGIRAVSTVGLTEDVVRGCPTPLLFLRDRASEDLPAVVAERLRAGLPVVITGESTDGTHIGPLLTRISDHRRYLAARRAFWFEHQLTQRGFTERPAFLPVGADTRHRLAAALALLLAHAEPDTCVLLEEGRIVRLWTAVLDGGRPAGELRDQLAWSLGLVRDLVVSAGAGDTFLAVCRTPAGATADDLESNSGKGATPEEARFHATCEAAERFAGWSVNDHGVPDPPGGAAIRPTADFHPYGPAFEAGPAVPAEPAWYPTRSLRSGGDVWVPISRVAFPCTVGDRAEHRIYGDTTGLAIHSDEAEAVVRGAREVLERDNFYPGFLHQRVGIRLAPEDFGLAGALPGAELVLVYYAGHPVPIVHAFGMFDRPGVGFAARGSGSGLTWPAAVTNAVRELEQVAAQVAGAPVDRLGAGHAAWRRPEVVDQLRAYLARQPAGEPPAAAAVDARGQLATMVDWAAARGTDVLLATLPSPITGWHPVRVLVPGATTNPWPSSSAGGRRLASPSWGWGVPT
jgi:ribosomal protein S12 methylthiotransferase accessory factor